MATIVSVDDDEIILSVLAAVLEKSGHKVLTATNGSAALELIRQNHPDLVISDIRMTPMSGMELLRAIRQEWPNLPVIMLTAFTSPDTIRESRELGATDHLSKPFTAEDVIKAIQRVLSAQEQQPTDLLISAIIKEYMVREQLKTFFDAKTALADELYWASQKYDKAKVLLAMNNALNRTDIAQEHMDLLLFFRESLVRIKQMAEAAGTQSGVDASRQMQIAAACIAGPSAKGGYTSRVRLAAKALGTESDKIAENDIAVLHEYADHIALQGKPGSAPLDPHSIMLTDDLPERIAGFTSVELQRLLASIRFGPVLKDSQVNTLSLALRNLRGCSEPACKALRAILKDHKSLASIGTLISKGAPQLLTDLKMSEMDLQQIMTSLNAIADRGHVLLRIKEIIETSTEKKPMAAFWIRYWKKRYSDDF
ncbi:MAG: response regulator [bacterium]